MTLRERIADWISCGALTRAREDAEFQLRQCGAWAALWADAIVALEDIEEAARDDKSGTARKVHRMATEALK